ncbi:MAG: cadmium-translocating P-type ATPase [Desulfovibrio sp.]|nr:cadmium-translocating P-type ATPase [Desulfovibrio sp.]
MEDSFTVKGLTCPNCASKIEADIRALHGIAECSINIVQQTLHIRSVDDLPIPHAKDLAAIVARYEGDVLLLPRQGQEIRFHYKGKQGGVSAESIRQTIASLPMVASCAVDTKTHTLSLSTTSPINPKHLLASMEKALPALSFTAEDASKEEDEEVSFGWMPTLGAILFVLMLVLLYGGYGESFFVRLGLIASYGCLGNAVFARAVRQISRGNFFDENTLMMVATIGAFGLGEYPEAVAVMLFYNIGEYFQEKAVAKSKRSIAHLMDLRVSSVHVIRDAREMLLAPEEVVVGDRILVRPGEKIPVDGTIAQGESHLDKHALTGETKQERVRVGDSVLAGSINCSNSLELVATHTYVDSTVAQILDMVEHAQARKSRTEQYITRFAKWYTPIVVFAALAIMLFPPLLGLGDFETWVRRGLVFLIVSCPCALVLSIPLTFFAGIGACSKQGILVKGGNFLEALARVKTVVFDKTGTLTEGRFMVTNILPAEGFSKEDVLALAQSVEKHSLHPLALSICACRGKETQACTDVSEHAGEGLSAMLLGKRLVVGKSSLLARFGIAAPQADGSGTMVSVGYGDSFVGTLVLGDRLRAESKEAVRDVKALGLNVLMLSGDTESQVAEVALELGISQYQGGLLPTEKVAAVERALSFLPKDGRLAFVGDGINDAPVLARADVGIAMGGLGTDAALEAADVVIMNDEPRKIATSIVLAKKTVRRAQENIAFALGIKGLFLLLGALGMIGLWPAVFADVGVTVLCVANALRLGAKS